MSSDAIAWFPVCAYCKAGGTINPAVVSAVIQDIPGLHLGAYLCAEHDHPDAYHPYVPKHMKTDRVTSSNRDEEQP